MQACARKKVLAVKLLKEVYYIFVLLPDVVTSAQGGITQP